MTPGFMFKKCNFCKFAQSHCPRIQAMKETFFKTLRSQKLLGDLCLHILTFFLFFQLKLTCSAKTPSFLFAARLYQYDPVEATAPFVFYCTFL
jgi:hypothetical protein